MRTTDAQVRKLMEEMSKRGQVGQAALRCGSAEAVQTPDDDTVDKAGPNVALEVLDTRASERRSGERVLVPTDGSPCGILLFPTLEIGFLGGHILAVRGHAHVDGDVFRSHLCTVRFQLNL